MSKFQLKFQVFFARNNHLLQYQCRSVFLQQIAYLYLFHVNKIFTVLDKHLKFLVVKPKPLSFKGSIFFIK